MNEGSTETWNPETGIERNPEINFLERREKSLMVKYMNWGKKSGINWKKKLISLVGIKENAVGKWRNVLWDRERQGVLCQAVQMADSP